jgi:predicted nucleic acid-binding protein
MKFVLDASVAVKWLVPETESGRAREVFSAWNEGLIELAAPDILPSELANTLWKKAQKGELNGAYAMQLLKEFINIRLPLVPSENLAMAALSLSLIHRHPVYDSIYVALALQEKCSLLTADEKLKRIFGKSMAGTVHLLRDWTL